MIVSHPAKEMSEKIDQIHHAVYALAAEMERLLSALNQESIAVCSACGRDIDSGNACIDLTRQVAHIDTEDGKIFVTVIDSEVLATFCASCGNDHAYGTNWRRKLRPSLELDNLQDLNEKVCDCCGCEVPQIGARVVVNLMIAQIDGRKDHYGESDVTPIHAEDVLVFCPACGNKMNYTKLQRAVDNLLINVAGGDRQL